jgi:hypothetical protein
MHCNTAQGVVCGPLFGHGMEGHERLCMTAIYGRTKDEAGFGMIGIVGYG